MLLRFSCLSDYVFITIFARESEEGSTISQCRKFEIPGNFFIRVISFDQFATIDECGNTNISVDCVLRWKMCDVLKISESPRENERDLSPSKAMHFINSMLRCVRDLRFSVVNICESQAAKRASERGKLQLFGSRHTMEAFVLRSSIAITFLRL